MPSSRSRCSFLPPRQEARQKGGGRRKKPRQPEEKLSSRDSRSAPELSQAPLLLRTPAVRRAAARSPRGGCSPSPSPPGEDFLHVVPHEIPALGLRLVPGRLGALAGGEGLGGGRAAAAAPARWRAARLVVAVRGLGGIALLPGHVPHVPVATGDIPGRRLQGGTGGRFGVEVDEVPYGHVQGGLHGCLRGVVVIRGSAGCSSSCSSPGCGGHR